MIASLGLSFLLSACASAPVERPASARRAELFPLMNPPLLRAESDVALGGFSSLAYDGVDAEGSLVFWATTDRGPNPASYKDKKKKDQEFRPFLIPDFQPTWVKFKLNKATREIVVLSQTRLTTSNGRPLTGLPNLEEGKKRPGDEVPVNTNGEVIAMDLMGLDTEGFCFDQKNFVWMVEEYRPSILKFDRDGKLLRRYMPMGSFGVREIKKIDADYGRDLVQQSLPKDLRDRKRNRGFEGVACFNNKVYAMLQSPLKGEGKKVRLIEFDPEKEDVSRELIYKLDDKDEADKIGDLTTDGHALYAIEQNGNTGNDSIHKVYKLTLPDEKSKDLEVQKELFVDLVKMGFSAFEKVEGLAFVSPHLLAVVSDNDFGLVGPLDLDTGLVPIDRSKRTTLGLIPVAAPPAP